MQLPPDGLCFYYCMAAGRHPREFMLFNSRRSAEGVWQPQDLRAMMRMATDFRNHLIDCLLASSRHQQACRLSQTGVSGYPDGEDFLAATEVLGGGFQIQQADCPRMGNLHYGDSDSPVIVRLRRHKVLDGDGVSQEHFDIDQLWDTVPISATIEAVISAETSTNLATMNMHSPRIRYKALASSARRTYHEIITYETTRRWCLPMLSL